MTASDERRRILDLLDNGVITAEQAIQLLASVEDADERDAETSSLASGVAGDFEGEVTPNPSAVTVEPAAAVDADTSASAETTDRLPDLEAFSSEPEDAPEPEKADVPFDTGNGWRNWWQWPMWIGVGITVIAAGFMYLAYRGSGFGFWFACTWFPFLFGVALMALAWASRTARWVHVRVHQKPGEKPERIAISMPIPLRLTAWALQTFKDRIPGMDKYNAAEMVMALRNVTPEAPLYVKVDEGDDGEKVEVYIG